MTRHIPCQKILFESCSMKTNPNQDVQNQKKTDKALAEALTQAEMVKVQVEQAAQDLSSVNSVLKQGMKENNAAPGIGKALQESEDIEDKVQDAADKLAVVNAALKDEVSERLVLESKLEALTEQEQASRHAAVHDPLTGLPNRVLFNDRLEHGLAQAKRHGWSLAVMFIDLNDFKKINDTYGHDAGDSVLKTIASRLTQRVRDDDTVSRHGGDEFLYLLTAVSDEEDLPAIAEKILASIQEPCSVNVGNIAIHSSTGASIGIALFPKNGNTAEVLIQSADKAMYQAKKSKSRYAFAQ